MNIAGLLETSWRFGLVLAGLLLPGSMLLRALRLPWSLAAAFSASAVALYALVLGFVFAGVPLTLGSLGGGLAAITALAGLRRSREAVAPISPWHACFMRLHGWTPLYVLFWIIAGWRLVTQPLTGPDVTFRWSWLAEQMVRLGTLDFYPPRTAADFLHYFWVESIPPGVAGLYGWAYACGGSTHPLWTSPVVALQLLALHELVWRLGSRWGGEAVARRAVLLAAATPLLSWSVLIGQETGLIAVAACGLAWTVAHLRDDDWKRWTVLAAVFATMAASAREYGIAFGVLAVVAALLSGPPRRALWLAALAIPLACAWPVRTWVLTGNPFYSLDPAGVFPVNPVFSSWSHAFHAPHAEPLANIGAWVGLGRYLLLWALPAVGGAFVLLALLWRRQPDARFPALLVLLAATLWWWSLSYTAGGLFYSLRVLSPAFALLGVAAAYGLTVWLPASANRITAIALAALFIESMPKTLVLPENPYRTPATEWSGAGGSFARSAQAEGHALREAMRSLPPSSIITDNAGFPRLLGPLGWKVVPLWSPDVSWLFDSRLGPEEIASRWRAAGYRYLIVSRGPSGAAFVMNRALGRAPTISVRRIAESGGNVILEATTPDP